MVRRSPPVVVCGFTRPGRLDAQATDAPGDAREQQYTGAESKQGNNERGAAPENTKGLRGGGRLCTEYGGPAWAEVNAPEVLYG